METSDKQPKDYPVKIEVISQKGFCYNGHKVGDSWVVHHKTPDGMCSEAFVAIMPFLASMEFGANFHWLKENKDVLCRACPDCDNPVVFRLTRIRE